MLANQPTMTIDARNQSLGRIASRIAFLLRGKHLPGKPRQRILVQHCRELRLDTKKMLQKTYKRTSGFPGHLKSERLREVFNKEPAEVLRRAVKGMLPRTHQRNELLKRLTIQS